jgi:hypothetical protein
MLSWVWVFALLNERETACVNYQFLLQWSLWLKFNLCSLQLLGLVFVLLSTPV